ncbi:MAG: nuclear transport factor 2 family protein [Candidatus Palauibacterales bacterium]|nr:nuclear transport factor 2 family protein [Candidatus Palauibacterales bacterium]MDP2483986.1 nuclear transport factor 2 family protein [Candidatus Palauibacterales bacterium]
MIEPLANCAGRMSDRSLLRASTLPMLLAAVLVSACSFEVEAEGDSDVQGTVDAMLTESAAAWNSGELEGFIDDYMESANTTYIGAGGLLTGFDAIRARYAPLFEPGASRDSLRFEDLRVRRLAAVDAIATARWILYRYGEVTGSGPFTLVLRHTSAGWKIIHDHSSSDPAPPPPAE